MRRPAPPQTVPQPQLFRLGKIGKWQRARCAAASKLLGEIRFDRMPKAGVCAAVTEFQPAKRQRLSLSRVDATGLTRRWRGRASPPGPVFLLRVRVTGVRKRADASRMAAAVGRQTPINDCNGAQCATTAVGVRGDKAALFQWVRIPPGALLQPEAPEVAAWQCRAIWRVRIPLR